MLFKEYIFLIAFLFTLNYDHIYSQESQEVEEVDDEENSTTELSQSSTSIKTLTNSSVLITSTTLPTSAEKQTSSTELLIYRYTLIGVAIAFIIVCFLALFFLLKYRRLKKFRSDVAYEIGPFKNY